MKLHQPSTGSLNTVTAYGDGYIEINKRRFPHALLLFPEGEVVRWPVESFEALRPESFDSLLALDLEVLVIGTGERQRFPHPSLVARLHAEHIGVEAMDTRAACRTYNILMSEGRKVGAALLLQ